ncbi:MAG: hypothetical protein COV47_02620 [Candidatus Diapherotrites archaeon CG11_big_fil_rev_8_21_14_0_20_37_9]|nr:MAG: hypothetical protein COV47_02620 [Candidatus Diapherotrites archaeon CG11_big_fil_rev_8_21_14_0_20_37_9]
MRHELENFIKTNRLKAVVFECEGEVHSAAKAAAQLKGNSMSVAKSIVLIDSAKEPLLVILLGSDKISFAKVKVLLGVSDVRLAFPEEVKEITGYEIGGVPPISIYGVRVIVDSSVADKKEVVCGGGDPQHLMRITVKEIIENIEDPLIADVKK